MGIFTKSSRAAAGLGKLHRERAKHQRRDTVRQGLRLESLENRVVFAGLSPVAVNDMYEAIANEALQVETSGLLANDVDAEGDALSAAEFLGPKYGQLDLNTDGTFSYQPNPGFTGVDGFLYQVDDGTSKSQFAAVTIQVTDPNVAPEGSNDIYELAEDTTLAVSAEQGVLANDLDANGDSLSVSLMDSAEHGSVQLQADGSFEYTPDPDFFGTDAFTYQITDGAKQSDLVVVEINVNPTNDAPIAVGETLEVKEDHRLDIALNDLLQNDLDVESTTLEFRLESAPEFGTLDIQPDGSMSYTPAPDFYGVDQFSYYVTDGDLVSNTVVAEIIVSAVQDAPVAENDFYSVLEDSVLEVDSSVLDNDFDVDADPITAELVDPPKHGNLVFQPDGTFQYTPQADFFGTDAFTYYVQDGEQSSDLAVVEIEIAAVNDAPLAVDDALSTDQGSELAIHAIDLLGNDFDLEGDELSLEIADGPTHGSLESDGEGGWMYTPEDGFVGSDQFTYYAMDGTDATLGTVSVEVLEPVRPVANNEAYVVDAGETLTVDAAAGLLANESLPEEVSDSLGIEVFRGPHSGELNIRQDGSFDYQPNAEFSGIDSVIYRTTLGELSSQLAVATLYVTAGEATESADMSDAESGPQLATEIDPTLLVDQEEEQPRGLETDCELNTPETLGLLTPEVDEVNEGELESKNDWEPWQGFFSQASDGFWFEIYCFFG